MSRSNGNGRPLRAALHYAKHLKGLGSRAAEASAANAPRGASTENDESDEREEEGDGDPTGHSGDAAGGTA
jgi:hypothetical protein